MILATSLSPNHINKDVQQRAINSWNKLGFECYSFNHPSEIINLQGYYGIDLIPISNTAKHIFGKHYILISEIINWFKSTGDKNFCITNSDIEFSHMPIVIDKIKKQLNKSLIIAHRYDYIKSKKELMQYTLGIDAFFMNKEHLKVFPHSLLCMGQCFWDYHIPFTAMENGIDVINMQNELCLHKKHDTQYSSKNWETTGKIFAIEHSIEINNIGRLNELVFNFLNINIKKITL